MTTQLATIDLDELREELHRSRETQSWSPRSTRNRWVPELQELLDAIGSGDQDTINAAAAAADPEAVRLATIVAQGIATDTATIAGRLEDDMDVEDVDDIAAMVAQARSEGVEIRATSPGAATA